MTMQYCSKCKSQIVQHAPEKIEIKSEDGSKCCWELKIERQILHFGYVAPYAHGLCLPCFITTLEKAKEIACAEHEREIEREKRQLERDLKEAQKRIEEVKQRIREMEKGSTKN